MGIIGTHADFDSLTDGNHVDVEVEAIGTLVHGVVKN